jgi:WD40 repeat protein
LPYFALEFCPGGSLAAKFDGMPWPAGRAATLVAALARGVDAAHQRGIVHRDLKPSNILLGADGTPKVSDFGIAKRLDAEAGQTRTGAVLGTPSYMAPEQAEGKSRDVGPAADVYSLGAILYELLTGRPPFQGPTPLDTILQVLAEPAVPPSRRHPQVPADLEAICLKCLEKRATARYATAQALAEDLDRFLAGSPTLARPHPSREAARAQKRTGRVVRRYYLYWALAGASLVLALAVHPLFFLLADARSAQTLPGLLVSGMPDALDAATHPKLATFVKGLPFSLSLLWLFLVCVWRLRRSPYVRALRPVQAGVVFRGHWFRWRWHFFWPYQVKVFAVAVSPDGRTIASGASDRTVRLWEAATGEERATLRTHPSHPRAVAFTPDGRTVASGGADGAIILWDTATGQARARLNSGDGPVSALGCTSDGSVLVGAGRGPAVRLWDLASGQLRATFAGKWRGLSSLAFTPDGKTLVVGGKGGVALWDVPAGGSQPSAAIALARVGVNALALAPDGKVLALASTRGKVYLWDMPARQIMASRKARNGRINAVAVSPDGKLVASAGSKGNVTLFDSAALTLRTSFIACSGPVYGLAWAPDGLTLASAGGDGTVCLWDVAAALRGVQLRQRGRDAG